MLRALLVGIPAAAALQLGGTRLTPLAAGRASGEPVAAETLWKSGGAIVFAIRRPG